MEHSDIVFIAVKPHILDSAVDNIKATLSHAVSAKLFVSVLAGTTLDVLEQVGCCSINNVCAKYTLGSYHVTSSSMARSGLARLQQGCS